MKERLLALRSNTLVFNSFALLMASGAVAAFGFIFWAIIARMFDDATVGIAATLLSLSSLISLLSLAGFDTTFVRFLPKSKRRQDYINSGLIIAGALSGILSLGFILAFPFVAPTLSFVTQNPLYACGFIIFTVITTLNTLTNSVFLAHRKAMYILFINILFSIAKVVLPFLFVATDAMTIFNIAGISQLVGLILSLWFIRRLFGHTYTLRIHFDILALSRKYSFAVYSASILNLLPPTILPLIITQQIGPQGSAYYYMAFTIATLLYTIAYSAMQSAFAEGSHAEHHLRQHIIKAAKLIALLLIPAAIILFFGAPYLLTIFGKNYSSEGAQLLQILCMSAIFVSMYSAMGAIFKVRHSIRPLVYMNVAYVVVILGGSYMFVPVYGLQAVGYAWMAGNIAAVTIGLLSFKRAG